MIGILLVYDPNLTAPWVVESKRSDIAALMAITLAAASTAGNAVAVPAIIASANPVYADAAAQATILVAASIVVTAIVVPLVTAWTARRVGARNT